MGFYKSKLRMYQCHAVIGVCHIINQVWFIVKIIILCVTCISKYGIYFLYDHSFILHWQSDTMFHHKVNGPCFIFSLDDLNGWIRSLFSLRGFNNNFVFIWCLSVGIIWQCCHTTCAQIFRIPYLTTSWYSEDIRPNVSRFYPPI